MKRFLFAVAAVALSACAAIADDTPATGTTTVPVVTSATPVAGYAPAQTQQRRGLFGRLRSRNTTTMNYSSPTMVAPATTPASPMLMPGTTTPQPMPTVKPASGTMMSGMVVQATGDLPPGQYTTTDGTIVQIGGTQPMMTPMTTPTTRNGLFGRLRNR
jgi:hypothetical protein